jgi:hypothetical protein
MGVRLLLAVVNELGVFEGLAVARHLLLFEQFRQVDPPLQSFILRFNWLH